MDTNNTNEAFRKIKKVEAPPFLLTRIRERIRFAAEAPAPVKWVWSFAATGILVLVLNLSILLKQEKGDESGGVENLVNTMQLNQSNELYR